MERLSSKLFFNLDSFEHTSLFLEGQPAWHALKRLKEYLDSLPLGKIACDIPPNVTLVSPNHISIGEGTIIQSGAYIEGPCVIGKNCEVRHGAFVRPYVLTGDGCVIGHATEAKHAIFLNGSKAPHFNYVGDSILGNDVNLGAGVICANFRLDQKAVPVCVEGEKFSTGLKKLGAIIGDKSKLGCNAVLNPGVLLKKRSLIRSLASISDSNIKLERRSHD